MFTKLSEIKLKAGIFDRPQIRWLAKVDVFETVMNETERRAWKTFYSTASKFLESIRVQKTNVP